MLLHFDLVYAADDTRFRLPFVNLGVCPEAGSSLLLPVIAGQRAAAELLLLGDFFGAETAIKNGLVNQEMPAGEVNPFAFDKAQQLCSQPGIALRKTKRMLKSASYDEIKQRILDESRTFSQLLHNDESKEARQQVADRLRRTVC